MTNNDILVFATGRMYNLTAILTANTINTTEY